MRYLNLFLFAALFLLAAPSSADYSTTQAGERFIERMVKRHQFDRDELTKVLGDSRKRAKVLRLMGRQAEAMPWHKYRRLLLDEKRIQGGAAFWEAHAETLARAEERYGVAPEMIVAILGVESRYGTLTGSHPVLDALATLAFDYPRRAKFFRSELEHYLLMAREEKIDPRHPTGSFTGAMGWGQFMPSSFRAYAVDFDGDGRRDLWGSPADAIGSVAHYFKRHGWRNGEAVALPAEVNGKQHRKLLKEGMKPKRRLAELTRLGVEIDQAPTGNPKATLIRLKQPTGHDYWLGLRNFYVITRYNHSPLYAMAAWQLSREIAAERARRAAGQELAHVEPIAEPTPNPPPLRTDEPTTD